MAAVEIHVHKDRLPKPIQGVKALLARIAAASPITIKVEKVDPVIRVVSIDPSKSKVQAEMDGSPALAGELVDKA